MELKTEDYCIDYDATTQTITCAGTLRLSGMEEYAPLLDLLSNVVAQQPPLLTLDLRKLEFLNSSGINVLSKFVIRVRQTEAMQMVVQGAKTIFWQEKSLKNLQRLMPSLRLNFD